MDVHAATYDDAYAYLQSLQEELSLFDREQFAMQPNDPTIPKKAFADPDRQILCSRIEATRHTMATRWIDRAFCRVVTIVGTDRARRSMESTLQDGESVTSRGPLQEGVIAFIQSNNWRLVESGGSWRGWHVGVFCTCPQVSPMTKAISDKLATPLSLGLIELHVEPRPIAFYPSK